MKLTLQAPINPVSVTQRFGVNGDYYQKNGINIKGHAGIDLQASHGQPVYAAHDGFAYYEWDNDQGEGVVIRSNTPYELLDGTTSPIKTIYWHLADGTKEPQFKSPITCFDMNSEGQPVKAGDLIGYADNTGFSTGDHLHFGLKPVSVGENLGTIYNIQQNNGYNGCIDPAPYLGLPSQFMFNTDLSYGMTSEDVRQLQIRLKMDVKYQTGYFGVTTRMWVMGYQLANKITPPLGYCGVKTRAKLNST